MIKGSEIRNSEYAIAPLLLDRWSPRAMTGEEIPVEELMRLFEAARWGALFVQRPTVARAFARRETEHWPTFLGLLGEGNKSWAKNAAALVLFISRTRFEYNGEPSITHSYDAGAAWLSFALQGFRQGLVVHGMEGFDYERARYERARAELKIPKEFQVEAMAAAGKPAGKEILPEKLQSRESPNDRRKVTESICEGAFRF